MYPVVHAFYPFWIEFTPYGFNPFVENKFSISRIRSNIEVLSIQLTGSLIHSQSHIYLVLQLDFKK